MDKTALKWPRKRYLAGLWYQQGGSGEVGQDEEGDGQGMRSTELYL